MAKRDKLNPTNAEIISSQDVSDSIQYRDVQNRQQLQHSRIEEKKPLWPWRVLAIVLGVLSCLLMYVFTSLGFTVVGSFTASGNDAQYVANHEKTLMAQTSPATPDTIPGCYGADSGSVLNLPIYVRQVNSYMVANQHYEDRRFNPQCSAYMPADQASGFAVLGNVAYATPQDVPQPEWFQAQLAQAKQQDQTALAKRKSLPKDTWLYSEHSVSENVKHDLKPGLWNTMAGILVGLAVYSMAFVKFKRNWVSQNIQYDTADINQHEDDQHLMINEELFDHFDIFPDIGAHSSVVPRALISHAFLTNKGLNKIKATKFYDKDTEIDGEKYFKGEPMFDEDSDESLTHMVPMIDEAHGDSLMDASAVPKDKRIRRRFDPAKTVYRQAGGGCGKLKGYTNWAEVINNDWTFPDYEPARPAGVYLVDTDPVNTMVLAITRAGKGQTIIEPTLDMWTRCNEKSNIVVNDPKGELLIKCYVKATVRGFQPVQFNLIEPVKTDIYNPLLMAADAAREGDSTRCAQYVESIGNVFFPADSGEDPVWPNAANNAFQRAAYGMIDYYYEAEKSLRARAERDHISPKTLETMVDQLWGKVTLYNCYQLFVQLTSKKLKNPAVELSKDVQANEDKYKQMSQADYDKLVADTEAKAVLWDNAAEIDELTLFFNATAALPRNSVRTLVGNADNALRAMGAAEKMLASVYGIAITAMSFFANPTISTLTSGTPSQNVDLAGLSFPRRFGVRFDSDFLATHHLATMQCRWTGYDDPNFEKPLGKDFTHTDMVTREGWARCFFKGIWPHDTGYLKLEILDPSSGRLIRTMFFQFDKRYLTTLDGAFYLKDPILDERVPNGGIIIELKQTAHGFKPGRDTFISKTIGNIDQPVDKMTVETIDKPIISQTSVHYGEKPKMIFLVTPPHLTAYAKLILILLKQLVDLNFEQSYTTKESQKPLYATQFMLDELGNLQSDGHGIDSFGTMLSIGLGQSQFFTIILQTLQQLRDVYGQDVDKVIQGNALWLNSNVFTPSGYTKMGDLSIGDEVLTADGTVTNVVGIYPQGRKRAYCVTLRDGSSVKASADHLWEVVRRKTWLRYEGVDSQTGKKIYVPAGPNGETTRFVHEVVNTMQLKKMIENNGHNAVALPIIKPAAHIKRQFPLDPYTLGVILGDGYITDSGAVQFGITSKKFGIIDKMQANGMDVHQLASYSRGGEQYADEHGYMLYGAQDALRQLGLIGHKAHDKFIPEQYLYGSVEQRLELLRGLMDTDGYVYDRVKPSGKHKGEHTCEMEYVTVSERLAKDIQQLIRSLGGRVSINVKKDVHYTSPTQSTPKQASTAYRLQNIRLPELCPFSLDYKVARWTLDRSGAICGELSAANYGNVVTSVEYVGMEEMQCIKVADSRHLYLTDDYIPTHNTANIVFLKSTDDQMIDTLSKMSGKTHRVVTNSKTITTDESQVMMRTDAKVSKTMTSEEVPVISYNDMAYIPKCNSMVFRAGTSAIWNRNETVLPMSWNLYKDTIINPGHEYSLKTIPSLSTAKDFDVKRNQPDFDAMLERRVAQAIAAPKATEAYQTLFGLSDADMARNVGDDNFADAIMRLVDSLVDGIDAAQDVGDPDMVQSPDAAGGMDNWDPDDDYDDGAGLNADGSLKTSKAQGKSAAQNTASKLLEGAQENTEVERQTQMTQAQAQDWERPRYCGGRLSRADLCSISGAPTHQLDEVLSAAIEDAKAPMQRDKHNFRYDAALGTFYVRDEQGRMDALALRMMGAMSAEQRASIQAAAKDPASRTFGEPDDMPYAQWQISDVFYRWLVSLDSWSGIAEGKFEQFLIRALDLQEQQSGT